MSGRRLGDVGEVVCGEVESVPGVIVAGSAPTELFGDGETGVTARKSVTLEFSCSFKSGKKCKEKIEDCAQTLLERTCV